MKAQPSEKGREEKRGGGRGREEGKNEREREYARASEWVRKRERKCYIMHSIRECLMEGSVDLRVRWRGFWLQVCARCNREAYTLTYLLVVGTTLLVVRVKVSLQPYTLGMKNDWGLGVGRQYKSVRGRENVISLLRRFTLVANHRREIQNIWFSEGKGCEIEYSSFPLSTVSLSTAFSYPWSTTVRNISVKFQK